MGIGGFACVFFMALSAALALGSTVALAGDYDQARMRSCPSGLSPCNGDCVDKRANAGNCGGCGISCPSGGICTDAVCSCPEGETICGAGTVCVDLTQDPRHCGSCNAACTNPALPICCAGCWYSLGMSAFCW